MAEKIDINRIQRDMFIEHKGEPYRVVDYDHVKPGKGQAFVRVKAKNMNTGNAIEITYKSSDSIELADFEQLFAEFSYKDSDEYHFLTQNTHEMISINAEDIKEEAKFLKEGMSIVVFVYKNKPIGIELPKAVELEVIETDPGFKGDTATGGSKPAKVETGAIIQVPLFINEGDIVKVDTKSGQYLERLDRAQKK
jgi:elongation factor P